MTIQVEMMRAQVCFSVDDLDDESYVLPFRFDDYLKERKRELRGNIEEIGGNYIALSYSDLDAFTYEDAVADVKTLETIIQEFITERDKK